MAAFGISKLGEDTARAGEILVTLAAKEPADLTGPRDYENIGHRFTEGERVYRLKRSEGAVFRCNLG